MLLCLKVCKYTRRRETKMNQYFSPHMKEGVFEFSKQLHLMSKTFHCLFFKVHDSFLPLLYCNICCFHTEVCIKLQYKLIELPKKWGFIVPIAVWMMCWPIKIWLIFSRFWKGLSVSTLWILICFLFHRNDRVPNVFQLYCCSTYLVKKGTIQEFKVFGKPVPWIHQWMKSTNSGYKIHST